MKKIFINRRDFIKKCFTATAALKPFFESKTLAWMHPGYTDGNPA